MTRSATPRKPRAKAPPLLLPDKPDFSIEARLIAAGKDLIAGLDEAGRGPLAGPVVAAAVILDPDRIPDGLDDSKKLKPAIRERLFAEILASAHVAVASASPRRIEATDIRAASLEAMARAAAHLGARPDHALVDGRDVPPGLCCPGEALVKGDRRSASIAAASIVAKVVRDRLMVRLGSAFPGYGFERHMGYGTAAHIEALARLGPCPHHRRTFSPLREMVGG
ncbi:MAG TPA: ribonuclease HII [Kaistiaceae bacterium]|nr:ribonuclease HII [Kaistiaceae bacterium]